MAGRSVLFPRDRSASERVRLGRLLATLLFAGALLPAAGPSSSAAPAQASETAIEAQLGSLPLYFVANRGQADERVDFYVQGSETNVYFTDRGITFQLSDRDSDKRWAVKLDFVGANRVTPQGRGRTAANINYFKGSKRDWETGIPTYSGLVYRDLWDGIDLVYSGTASSLKQSFVVHPGADPGDIRLAYRGATSVRRNPAGEITVSTPVGGFRDARPRSFQRVRGERSTVESSYLLETARKKTRAYGFQVGDYDRTRALVIDPEVVVYAGYIGGSGTDVGNGIAVDGAGAAYVTGFTDSTAATFPVTGGPDLSHDGGNDAFVAKVAPGGGSLVYAGYLGGSGNDQGLGIAVDGAGAAYVTGFTDSTEATFPVTGGPDLSHNGGNDAFVAKVAPGGGSLAYAGYLGGSGGDLGLGIAVDGAGAAYVTGLTNSTAATFPATGGPDLSHNGGNDAFVAKVAPGGGSLAYAGYLGGSGSDEGRGIAVDGSGAAYVTGLTNSTEATFPATGGPDLSHNGNFDAFVAKVGQSLQELTVSKAGGGSGTVTSSPGGIDCGLDCTESYPAATSVTLTATPAADSAFAGWSGGGCSGTGTCTVTMTASTAVTATFEIAQRSLTITTAGGGSGTVTSSPGGIDCGLDCGQDYAHGTLVTLTATPAADSAFAGWSGGGCGGTDKCVVTMDAAKSVTATFEIAQRSLTVVKTGSGGGTVTSAPAGIDCGLDCTESYAHGTLVTLTATPAANSSFTGWSGICSGAGTCAITMDEAKTVTALFTATPRGSRTLTVEKTGGGSGVVTSSPSGINCGSDCSQAFDQETVVTLTARPSGLSTFGSWTGCDRVTGDQCVVTVSGQTTVTAPFVAPRTLTVEKEGPGSGEVTSTPEGIDCGGECEADYADGTDVVLTATPGEGSTFGSWNGCDEVSDDECTISLTSDATVTVRFEAARVVHERRVTLFLGGHLVARGRVRVLDGFGACAARVPVRIQRKTPKGWVTEARRVTRDDGRFRARIDDRPDTYRVRAPARKVDGGPDACKKALSRTVRHKHEQPQRLGPPRQMI